MPRSPLRAAIISAVAPSLVSDIDRGAEHEQLPDEHVVSLVGGLQQPHTQSFGSLEQRGNIGMPASNGDLTCGNPAPGGGRIGAANEQGPDNLGEPVCRCQHERRGAVVCAPVRSRAAFQELAHQLQVAARRRPHERREAAPVCRVDLGALGEQFLGSRELSESSRTRGGQRSHRSGLGLAPGSTAVRQAQWRGTLSSPGHQRDAFGVREDSLGRPTAPHLHDCRRTLAAARRASLRSRGR